MKLLFIFLISLMTCGHMFAQNSDNTQCDILHCTDHGVGIGTDTIPAGFILAVSGKVLMENGRVDLAAQWPDYVFEKDYNFLNMPELKKYIQANGHLPNVPAAATVKKEGIDVAEMNALLLEKIEELSLYIIQLQDRLNILRQQQEKSQTNKQVK